MESKTSHKGDYCTFLKINYNVEYETVSTNLDFVTLKYIALLCTLNGSFINDFVTSYISHLENIGLLHYTYNSDIETFYYTVSKITFISIASNFIRKVFKYWKAIKLIVTNTCFPKI